jgi:hypothetical protein
MQTNELLPIWEGSKLPNGAILIETYVDEDCWTVLAMRPGMEFDKYVTWTMRPGDYQSTQAGHYHNELYDAVVDYYKRSGRMEKLNVGN